MNRVILILAALAAWTATAATPGRTATEAYVTNRIAAAVAALPAPDFSTNNAELVETIQTKAPAPDFSTDNAALVGTIEAKAPAPGNYEIVSNRAMSAIQAHQTLQPATNYTDRATNEVLKSAIRADAAAISAFASTGAVARASVYGTPTRWTDATGCVWEVVIDSQWSVEYKDPEYGPLYGIHIEPSGLGNGMYWIPMAVESVCGEAKGDEDSTVLVWEGEAITDFTARRTLVVTTNLVGRVALTNDIPDVSGYATPADVTAAIREQSLGGIWDETLQIWWTPRMRNGSLTYEATTNVNLNAEN